MGQRDVQDQPPVGAQLAGVHHQAVGDLGEGFHHAVELAGAHAHAAPVQGGVGTAVDDAGAVGQDLDPVAVPPAAGEVGVVALPVARPVRVVPEADRHRRHRLADDQLADLADHRLPSRIQCFHRRPQAAAGDGPGPHRPDRDRADEPGAQVGATGQRAQDHVVLHVVVDPAEALRGQRRPGRAHPAQRGQVVVAVRRDAGLGAGQQVRRPHAEVADPVVLSELPQRVGAGIGGAAVVGHHGRPDQQAAGQEVPHHPAGRGVPEEHVLRTQVQVQGQRLEVFQHDPAVPVHDRLGQAGGARGVQHPQRVVERDVGVLRFAGGLVTGVRSAELVPVQDRDVPEAAGGAVQGGGQHHGGQAGQRGRDLPHHVVPAVLLAVVVVAGHRDQHGRLDLGEPVDHAGRPEVRRAG